MTSTGLREVLLVTGAVTLTIGAGLVLVVVVAGLCQLVDTFRDRRASRKAWAELSAKFKTAAARPPILLPQVMQVRSSIEQARNAPFTDAEWAHIERVLDMDVPIVGPLRPRRSGHYPTPPAGPPFVPRVIAGVDHTRVNEP